MLLHDIKKGKKNREDKNYTNIIRQKKKKVRRRKDNLLF